MAVKSKLPINAREEFQRLILESFKDRKPTPFPSIELQARIKAHMQNNKQNRGSSC